MKKWYLQTWFIALMFLFWEFIIPLIIGVILLVLQIVNERKINEKYGSIDSLDSTIQDKTTTLSRLETDVNETEKNLGNLKSDFYKRCVALDSDYQARKNTLEHDFNLRKDSLESDYKLMHDELESTYQKQFSSFEEKTKSLKTELQELESTVMMKQFDFSDYSALTSEECKNKLSSLKLKEKELFKSDDAITILSDDTKKVVNNNIKQMIRCFNAESDNIILSVTASNIDSMRSKLTKSFETINRIFETDGLKMTSELLDIKLEELNLIYVSEIKKEQERELQREIKEQMKEEERVRREIEKEKAKIEKDQTQFSNELSKVMKYLQKTDNDVEKQLYIEKIKELESKIKSLEEEKATVLEREANARAGFVYIISNIGSFGDDVYKIGMTRRLEPMDRIKELSSASVPFEFDVHAMIFSDDAPALENMLHHQFDKFKVNKVNPRKEFFKVPLESIEEYVKSSFDSTVEFTRIPVATEYRQSLEMS